MLIGISGKMGSGKNLVCTIIQGLTAAKKHNIENPSFEWIKKYYINSIWEQKAFAGKLKQTASLLTGIPVEKFEDQEFKNTELPEEWWVYKVESFNDDESYDIIGSYEDRYELLDNHNFDVEEHNKLYGDLDPKMTEEEFNKEFLIKTTPRLLLQIIGTECIRDKVHPNAWVNALFADYKSCSLPDETTFIDDEGFIRKNSSQWIITDMRFPNELEAVKSRGGITIRVNRPYDSLNQDSLFSLQKQQETNNHPSETALDNAEFDYTIENNSTIEDLIHTVSLILKREKII